MKKDVINMPKRDGKMTEERRKRSILILCLALLCLVFIFGIRAGLGADCIRCNGRLAYVGDSMYEVLMICGEPDFRSIVGRNINRECDVVNIGGKVYFLNTTASGSSVERWTYNFGPCQSLRILTFERDKLVKIEFGRKP